MPDDTLKIRVDVDSATLRQLSDELKRVTQALQDIKPNDPKFSEGAQLIQELRGRITELSAAAIKGGGDLGEMARGHQAAADAIGPESEQVKRLIDIMQSEGSTTAEISAAQRELTGIYKENATILDIATGKWKDVASAVSQGRDVTQTASSELFSSNARLKESYFSLGEQLRRQAVENGGYVTSLQMQNIAQQVAAKSGVELKTVLQQMDKQIQANNIAIVENKALLTSLSDSWKGLATQAFAAYAAYQSMKFLTNAAEEATRIQLLRQELTRLGEAKGFNATALIKQMDEAAGGTVKQLELMQIALRSVQLGNIDLTKLPMIMEKLDYQSKLLGVDTKELFDQFIRGAETGSRRFQVQFGLLYDVKAIEEKYAASIGTTVANLSEEEKATIRVSAGIEALSKRQTDNTSQAVLSAEAFERVSVVFDEAKVTAGALIATPLAKFLLSIGLEALIATEGVVSTAKALYMVYQASTFDFSGAKATFNEIGSIGEQIKKQVAEIGSLWVDTGKKAETAKEAIGGEKPTPKHLKGREELERERQDLAEHAKAREEALKFMSDFDIANATNEQEEIRLVENKKHGETLRQLRQMLTDVPELHAELNKRIEDEQQRHTEAMRIIEAGTPREVKETALPAIGDDMEMVTAQMERFQPLIGSLQQGFAAVGASIQTNFIDKVIGSTSLFQNFIGGVLKGIMQIAERVAASAIIGGILSLIPGVGSFGKIFTKLTGFAAGGTLNEAVVGVGMRTGRAYSFGENEPEVFTPLSKTASRFSSIFQGDGSTYQDSGSSAFSGLTRGAAPMEPISIDGKVQVYQDGRDLHGAWRINEVIYRKGTGNG